MRKKKIHEPIIEMVFRISSYVSILAVAFIIIFILSKGIQPFLWFNKEGTYSFIDFITGMEWDPSDIAENARYGILYMIVGSILATGGAILIGVPISLFAAAFLSELAPPRVQKLIRNGIMLMAGIPSVIYGIFGLGFIVPKINAISTHPYGESLLAVIIVLTMMILPTMIVIAENAIASVPQEYRQASYALGASKVYTTMACAPAGRKERYISRRRAGCGARYRRGDGCGARGGKCSGRAAYELVRPYTAAYHKCRAGDELCCGLA